jgi:hypothetical protein
MCTPKAQRLARGALLASIALSLIACRGPVEYVTKEVQVPVYVPLRAELTADVRIPALPPYACSDAAGRATICNSALADWGIENASQLQVCRGQVAKIRDLQPKPNGGP